jgi:hypothetical protein
VPYHLATPQYLNRSSLHRLGCIPIARGWVAAEWRKSWNRSRGFPTARAALIRVASAAAGYRWRNLHRLRSLADCECKCRLAVTAKHIVLSQRDEWNGNRTHLSAGELRARCRDPARLLLAAHVLRLHGRSVRVRALSPSYSPSSSSARLKHVWSSADRC